MRTLTATQTRLYTINTRASHVRVDVEDGDGSFQNLRSFLGHDWIMGVEWGEDVDADTADATILIKRDADHLSMARLMQASRCNLNAAGSYDPLLAVYRKIRIYGAVTPANMTPGAGDWDLLFDGRIREIDDSADPIQVQATDLFGMLIDRFVESPSTYGSALGTAVETVMQDIIDDWGTLFTLYTPSSPGWNVTTFESQTQSLADQLTLLSDQIGWSLRYKWDSGSSAFRLTFFEYDRATTTSAYTFSEGAYWDISQASLSSADIRNAIDVVYSDAADLDATGAPIRKTVSVSDATSITAYGRKWMSIAEDATSNIDSSTEATTLANNVLSDLKDPTADFSIDAPFHGFVELGDIYTIEADNIRFSADQTVSVVGYRHSFSAKHTGTMIQCRATYAAGGSRRWFSMAGVNGVGSLLDLAGPEAPDVTISEDNCAVKIVPTRSRNEFDWFEVHAGASGFTPDLAVGSTTLVSRLKGSSLNLATDRSAVPIGEAIDFVVYRLDRRGNRSTGTRVAAKRARRAGPQMLAAEARIASGFPGGVFNLQTRGSTFPPDGWTMRVGTWATDAALDSGGTYAAPRTGKYGFLLTNTATATEVYSDPFPITLGRSYRLQLEMKASNNTNTITIEVEWLDADQAVVSTETIYNSAATAANAWQLATALVSPPSSTAYARVVATKAAAAFYVLLDRVLFEEAPVNVEDVTAGIDLFDDFEGTSEIGTLPWGQALFGSDTATYPSTLSKVAAASGATSWTERGILRITTPAQADYGGVIYLGDASSPQFYDLPPVGVVLKFRMRAPGTATNLTMWAGLFDTQATFPDGALANTIYGVGVRAAAAGATANWKVIARDGTSETSTDLGVAMSSSWATVGFRRTLTGIQPMLGDHNVGSPITTNLPSGSPGLSLMFGTYTTSAAAKQGDVDFCHLAGRFRRYDP